MKVTKTAARVDEIGMWIVKVITTVKIVVRRLSKCEYGPREHFSKAKCESNMKIK